MKRKGRQPLDDAIDLKRFQVLLDPPTVEAALVAGKGNLSLGIRAIAKADAPPAQAKR
jgi:microcystin degradation protein MlrC